MANKKYRHHRPSVRHILSELDRLPDIVKSKGKDDSIEFVVKLGYARDIAEMLVNYEMENLTK